MRWRGRTTTSSRSTRGRSRKSRSSGSGPPSPPISKTAPLRGARWRRVCFGTPDAIDGITGFHGELTALFARRHGVLKHTLHDAHRHAALVQVVLDLADGVRAEVEDAGREGGVGLAVGQDLVHV